MSASALFMLLVSGSSLSATAAYTASATNDSPGGATVSFAGLAIGTAKTDRCVAVAVCLRNGSAITITGVTIGGIAATQIVHASNGGTNVSDIWVAAVPTGATATVVVTCSTTPLSVYIGAWELHNLLNSGSATSTATTTTNGGTMTLASVLSGGVVLGVAGDNTATTVSWTTLTSDWLNNPSRTQSGAHAAYAAPQSSLGVTATLGSINAPAFAVASFR